MGGADEMNKFIRISNKFIKSEGAAKEVGMSLVYSDGPVKRILDLTDLEDELPEQPAPKRPRLDTPAQAAPTKALSSMNITELVEYRNELDSRANALKAEKEAINKEIRRQRDAANEYIADL
jgi:hypothetical protein